MMQNVVIDGDAVNEEAERDRRAQGAHRDGEEDQEEEEIDVVVAMLLGFSS